MKKIINPCRRNGFCKTISVSVWPKPPTFGLLVICWSTVITSPSLTNNSGPLGIIWIAKSEPPVSMLNVRPVFFSTSILIIFPANSDVKTLLLLFEPSG